jgi:hypothetical protein
MAIEMNYLGIKQICSLRVLHDLIKEGIAFKAIYNIVTDTSA